MIKSKISKIGLLSYLDGELDEGCNKLVKDYLIDSDEDTGFLEDIVKVENILSKRDDYSIPEELKEKIFTNANTLLKRKREALQGTPLRNEYLKESIIKIKDYLFKFDFKLSYEYAVLCSLVVIFVGLLRTPTHIGEIVAFEMEPEIVLAETNYEYFISKENDEGE